MHTGLGAVAQLRGRACHAGTGVRCAQGRRARGEPPRQRVVGRAHAGLSRALGRRRGGVGHQDRDDRLAARGQRHPRECPGTARGRQLDRAKRFEARGQIPAVERLNAQVARDEAARGHVSAQRDLEIAAMRLQRLLVSEQPVGVTTPLFVVTSDVGSLAHWLGLAEKDSPILRAFAARKSQAEQGIVAAEARWKPEVYAYGTYNMIRHYQTLIEPNWRAGVGVSFALFAREDRANQVFAAREALRAVESQDGETRNRLLTA